MKKLLTLLLSLGLVFSLAACSKDETPVDNQPVETPDETPDVTPDVTPDETGNEIVYPTGFFNYKFADPELRLDLMAAAESYLMNNMYAGVPLFANGSFNMYSERLQLPVESYVAVMGYGTEFGTMSADDSTILMDNGENGVAGEYTYRTSISENPTTFQQWLYDDSVTADVLGLVLDTPYYYAFNADKSGYSVEPSMAAADPMPMATTITETGKEVSKVWRIDLRDDLVWKYPSAIDTTGYSADHEVINAEDFIWTYEMALSEQWFRAVSGGGDFLASTSEILNAQAFVDGEVEFDQVGLRMIDENTLEFEFVNDMSEWNVKYWMSSFVMTPINEDMYSALGDQYGTNYDKIAYTGAYYIDYYEPDKILRLKENDVFHSSNRYFYTGYTLNVIEDPAIRFEEFLAGKLESTTLPTEKFEEYKNYPGIKQVPGATTYRLMINGLETEAGQKEQFSDSTWIPEPILANQDFKMAMFFAVDRQKLAEEVLKTSTTNMFLFSDAYLVDAEGGVPFRNTPQGDSVGEGLSPSTYGYNFDAAKAYFELALDDLVAAGVYAKGDVITLGLNFFANSAAQELFASYMKTAYEEAFVSDMYDIRVELDIQAKDFPSIYYDYMMIGQFDLSIGGISGSTLDAASFLDTYSSDNRSGFTLNWGVDTSVAEIELNYTDFKGNEHYEMWSYDAIVSAMNGEVYLVNGEEAEVPAAKDIVLYYDSFTFEINLYNDPTFTDITYTLETWNDDLNDYAPVEGLIEITPDNQFVLIKDLVPNGDYQLTINYAYTEDPSKTGTSVAPWFYLVPDGE